MAKQLRANPADINSILTELYAALLSSRDGGVRLYRDFLRDDRKATLNFTSTAFQKMSALVAEYSSEVQWHGVVRRIDESTFEVYDILVPPHEVTSATVDSDPIGYNCWQMSLPDDVFNALHFHGHSHVNMTVSPSAVDNQYRKDLVSLLRTPDDDQNDDAFYIFLIMNKQHAWSAQIFDLKYNALYDTEDITSNCFCSKNCVFEDGTTMEAFIKDAKTKAVHAAHAAHKHPATYKRGTAIPATSTHQQQDSYEEMYDYYAQHGYDPEEFDI